MSNPIQYEAGAARAETVFRLRPEGVGLLEWFDDPTNAPTPADDPSFVAGYRLRSTVLRSASIANAPRPSTVVESETGLRLTSVESRLVAVEGRLSGLAAGQSGHTVTLMRIADTLAEHTARFEQLDSRLNQLDAKLDAVLAAVTLNPYSLAEQ